jgi:hypothetical protein
LASTASSSAAASGVKTRPPPPPPIQLPDFEPSKDHRKAVFPFAAAARRFWRLSNRQAGARRPANPYLDFHPRLLFRHGAARADVPRDSQFGKDLVARCDSVRPTLWLWTLPPGANLNILCLFSAL